MQHRGSAAHVERGGRGWGQQGGRKQHQCLPICNSARQRQQGDRSIFGWLRALTAIAAACSRHHEQRAVAAAAQVVDMVAAEACLSGELGSCCSPTDWCCAKNCRQPADCSSPRDCCCCCCSISCCKDRNCCSPRDCCPPRDCCCPSDGCCCCSMKRCSDSNCCCPRDCCCLRVCSRARAHPGPRTAWSCPREGCCPQGRASGVSADTPLPGSAREVPEATLGSNPCAAPRLRCSLGRWLGCSATLGIACSPVGACLLQHGGQPNHVCMSKCGCMTAGIHTTNLCLTCHACTWDTYAQVVAATREQYIPG